MNANIDGSHVNTVRFTLIGANSKISVTASSLGGGIIEVVNIDGVQLSIKGEYNTMIIFSKDVDETAKYVSNILSDEKIVIDLMEKRTSENNNTQLLLLKSKRVIPMYLYDLVLNLKSVIKIKNHKRFE